MSNGGSSEQGELPDDSGEVRTGYVTQTHTGAVSWKEAIRDGEELGFDFVELYMDGASERTKVDINGVESAVAEAGLDLLVHLPFVDLEIGSPRAPVREGSVVELRGCIETAAEMGAEKAVLHPGTSARPPEWELDEISSTLLGSIRELHRFGADRGVEICAENLPGVPLTVHQFERVFENTEASMTFDTGHARVDGMDEAEMADFLREYAERVSHVHVNDSREARDEHVPTGSGTLDFETALAPLRDGWTGTVSAEVYTFDSDYLELSKRKLDGVL
ncbi:sugar phosphate isomerase/epimerase family protein [Halorussus litoreus]|uniref:sugar phosphate isomerase/epimerase family protein n=1 Tax=Halorussus litoreus TaxID=1710536 RepID=UPI000E2328AA|nr:sugar phosphate isomerase/epimerase family protein [Halorussus litoreus]